MSVSAFASHEHCAMSAGAPSCQSCHSLGAAQRGLLHPRDGAGAPSTSNTWPRPTTSPANPRRTTHQPRACRAGSTVARRSRLGPCQADHFERAPRLVRLRRGPHRSRERGPPVGGPPPPVGPPGRRAGNEPPAFAPCCVRGSPKRAPSASTSSAAASGATPSATPSSTTNTPRLPPNEACGFLGGDPETGDRAAAAFGTTTHRSVAEPAVRLLRSCAGRSLDARSWHLLVPGAGEHTAATLVAIECRVDVEGPLVRRQDGARLHPNVPSGPAEAHGPG